MKLLSWQSEVHNLRTRSMCFMEWVLNEVTFKRKFQISLLDIRHVK